MKRNILFGVNVVLFVATYVVVILAATKKVEFPAWLFRSAAAIVVVQQAAAVLALFRSTNFFSPDNELNADGWDLLATLWKFQKKSFPGNAQERWSLAISPQSADFADFASGLAKARKLGYIEIQNGNHMIHLSGTGYQFCQQNEKALNKRKRLFYIEH
jgi:hypothetical protein